MAVTPEGKIKKMVKAVLAEFDERRTVEFNGTRYAVGTLKQYWPVPSGFGASDLDCIVCYYGMYVTIETKAPGKKPTPRQELTSAEVIGADGYLLVIDGERGCQELRDTLTHIKELQTNANDR